MGIRIISSLLGLAVLLSVFAGTYYAPQNLQAKTAAPSFQVAPGDSAQVRLLPTVAGTPIAVQVHAVGGPVDVFVMEAEWAARLAGDGKLNLTQPFSFEARPSRMNVSGPYAFTLVSDGRTEHLLVLGNGGGFYRGGAVPDPHGPTNGTLSIEVTIRYLEEESRSLWLAYLAAAPGVALVLFTVGHVVWRRTAERPRGRPSGR